MPFSTTRSPFLPSPWWLPEPADLLFRGEAEHPLDAELIGQHTEAGTPGHVAEWKAYFAVLADRRRGARSRRGSHTPQRPRSCCPASQVLWEMSPRPSAGVRLPPTTGNASAELWGQLQAYRPRRGRAAGGVPTEGLLIERHRFAAIAVEVDVCVRIFHTVFFLLDC